MPLRSLASEQTVHVHLEGTVVVLRIRGCLDDAAGTAILQAVATAVDDEARRLDIDLREVTAFTASGARSLVTCRALLAGLSEGLHYRTGKGPGRDALLAAYADLP